MNNFEYWTFIKKVYPERNDSLSCWVTGFFPRSCQVQKFIEGFLVFCKVKHYVNWWQLCWLPMFFLHDFCFKSRQMTVTIIRNPWTVAGIVMVVLMVLRTPMAHCREAPRKSWTTTLQQSQIWELISWGLWGLGLGVFFSDKILGRIWKVCYHCPNFSSLEKIILLDSSLTFCNWKEDTSLWKKTLGFQSWKRESAFQYQMQDRMHMAPLDKQ